MRLANRAAYIAGVTVIVLSAVSTAQGQVVTFSECNDRVVTFSRINDAVPLRFFDAATTTQYGNKLIIGFNTGMDWTTWKATDFRASTAAYSYVNAMDTISFWVEAPEGCSILNITYTQGGAGSIARTGKALGATIWVVGDYRANLGTYGTNPYLLQTMDLTGMNMRSVPVSITTSLFAYATPYLGSASVAVTSAEVLVTLVEVQAPTQ
jgi:hypothetical protein